MMQVRMEAYGQAILKNPSLFCGAAVMDVGCGTGILRWDFFCKVCHEVYVQIVFSVTKVVVMSIFCYFIASVFLTLAGIIKNHF